MVKSMRVKRPLSYVMVPGKREEGVRRDEERGAERGHEAGMEEEDEEEVFSLSCFLFLMLCCNHI